MKYFFLAICLIFFSTSCSPSTPPPLPTYTPYPTYTPFVQEKLDSVTIENFEQKISGKWICEVETDHLDYYDIRTFNGVGLGTSEILYEFTEEEVKDSVPIIFSYRFIGNRKIEMSKAGGNSLTEYYFAFNNDDSLLIYNSNASYDCYFSNYQTPRSTGIDDLEDNLCISWKDAKYHINEYQCVEGVVTHTYDSEEAYFINFSDDRTAFYAVAFEPFWNNSIVGTCITVWGTITTYNNRPQIIIDTKYAIDSCK